MSQPSRTGSRPYHASGADANQNSLPRHGEGHSLTMRQDQSLQNVPTGPRNSGHTPHTFHSHHAYNARPRPFPSHSRFQHPHHLQQSYLPPQQWNATSQQVTRPPPASNQAWSSNADSYYSAMYDTETSSSIRMTRGPRGTNRQGAQSEAGKGIRGKKFGYALIGKESERYITEDLREQLEIVVPPIAGDPAAPSPLDSTRLAPQMIVDEFKKAGHLDSTRKDLLSHFQSSEHKDHLLQSLQSYLLQRIKEMMPEARQKLASQGERVQLALLEKWFEESAEGAEMVDDVFERLRGRAGDKDSLFASQGVIGTKLETRLSEVIQAEKRRVERKRGDTSDEEGDSTPLNKGSAGSGGSQTPMTTLQEAS